MTRKYLRHELLAAWLALGAACSAPTPEELLVSARDAIAQGEARTAEIHLRNLLQQEPGHAGARMLFGEVLLAAGDGAGAESNLRRAIERGADPAAAQVPLLRALLLQGKFAEVLEQSTAGPTLTGEAGIAALAIVGAAHRGLRQFAEAETAYRTVLESSPGAPDARVDLAQVLFEAGRRSEARALAEEVNREQPDYVPALRLLGSIEAAEGQWAAAEQHFSEARRVEESRGRGAGYAMAMAPLIEAQLAQRNLTAAVANADELLGLFPQSPIARYLKARTEVEQGALDAAEERLEPLVNELPSYWPVHSLLGRINAQQQQLGQAEMYLRTVVNNAPEDDAARLLLAEVYLQQNNFDGARGLLAGARAASAGGVAAALAGRASLAAGERDLAEEYFDRSEQGQSRGLREAIELSSVYMAAGEFDRAVRALESVPTDTPEAAQTVAYLLTVVQARRGDLAAAGATADRLVAELPTVGWPLVLRGTVAALGRDLAGARGFYEAALQREPAHVAALLALARIAAAQGRNDEAAGHLRRVIEIDPQHLNAIFGMAQLAVQRGDFAEAETWLASAPESAARFQLQGNLLMRQRRFADAADAYARAFELRPSGELATNAYLAAREAGRADPTALLVAWSREQPNDPQANFTLGTLALESGDEEAALPRYEAVLAANPNHAATLNNLAWLYDQRGDERALELAKRARVVVPNDPSVADTLGWLHVRRGESEIGLPLLAEAVRAQPSHPEIRYHHAVALADSGDEVEALDRLTTLLAEADDFPSRAAAEERLASLRESARAR